LAGLDAGSTHCRLLVSIRNERALVLVGIRNRLHTDVFESALPIGTHDCLSPTLTFQLERATATQHQVPASNSRAVLLCLRIPLSAQRTGRSLLIPADRPNFLSYS